MSLKSKVSILKEKLKPGRIKPGPAKSGKSISAKNFQEQQKKEEAFDYKDRGRKRIPLDQITGSVGRYHEFDIKFRLNPKMPPDRLVNIQNAMRAGKKLPPVKLYQIKDEYYALDGNHRISAAKEFGFEEIDADILEFLPSTKTLENIIYNERSEFQEKTGLDGPIRPTEIGQYAYLLKQISEHRKILQGDSNNPVSFKDSALDWYETIYLPMTEIVQRTKLLDHFPQRTAADFFIYISYHSWERGRKRKYGYGLNQLISNTMEEFREEMMKKKKSAYPEMVKEIVAFVLVNADAKKDQRIVDKLFLLDEVKDVHAVHGSIDIIAKIVLRRDLLSSDAVTIGEFINDHVRSIPGIVSTQTLIPGYSRTKTETKGSQQQTGGIKC